MTAATTRFAPSPTGRLHLGHAWSALFAFARAKHDGFILRFEDVDLVRCNPAFEQGMIEDLRWLGLSWREPVRRQSDHFDDYRAALARLDSMGLLYPCFCTRKDIQDEIARSPSAPHGPEGALYPGTCRALSSAERTDRITTGAAFALRLDGAMAIGMAGQALHWRDRVRGAQTATPEILGDVVLARKDVPASYHLCVTVDDHLQGVTLVTRGDDLFYATSMHRLLQALLDLDIPDYDHHALLLDENGRRFAKRDHAVTLESLRTAGHSPDDIRAMIEARL